MSGVKIMPGGCLVVPSVNGGMGGVGIKVGIDTHAEKCAKNLPKMTNRPIADLCEIRPRRSAASPDRAFIQSAAFSFGQ